MTATAPAVVKNDIVEQIAPGEEDGLVTLRLDSYRSNLRLERWHVDGLAQRLAAIAHVVTHAGDTPGIVYVLTKDETETAVKILQYLGIRSAAYHGGLKAEDRAEVLSRWQQGDYFVVCATSALGMGLDRADVRWIVHAGMPDSLLRYVQEIGRAGRDGDSARAIAIHDPDVDKIHNSFLYSSRPAETDFLAVAKALRSGIATRTAIVASTDIPESTVQKIVNEFRLLGWCDREKVASSYRYKWIGSGQSGVPDDLGVGVEHRMNLLKGALAYCETTECLSAHLSKAMGDTAPPSGCGTCSCCKGRRQPDLTRLVEQVQLALREFCPPIRAEKGKLMRGTALSYYALGPVGEAIARAKYANEPLSDDVVDFALEKLLDPDGPYAGADFDFVVAVPSRSSLVFQFAEAVATRLGVPCVELEKARQTRAQKGFRAKQNKKTNVKGAFRAPEVLKAAASVLLVDDIYDSGASMQEAGSLLAPAAVYPMTLARTKHQDDL